MAGKIIQLVVYAGTLRGLTFRKSAQATDPLCSTGGKRLAPFFLYNMGNKPSWLLD